ncbi:hypothetical protein RB195_000252 [Necator americanus]|uniref:E3 ubiquitin-protein ligase n=1 Tax=Necator americanus TaxID=51031 RepID=A0ABR1D8S0_NECAM
MSSNNHSQVPSVAVSSSGSASATALCGPNGSNSSNTAGERSDRSGSRSGSPPSQFMGPTAPNHGVAAPHQKNLARVQATAPPVVTCSPSSLSTQSVAPQIATIGASEHTDSSAEVLSVFECPVCLEYMLPPYLQCQAGHLVCGNCRPKLQCCPTCRGPTPSVRNLGLEKIANTVRFPCKFASSGCPLFFYHFDKVEHEEACECRPYSCPCPGAACKWQGALNDVMDHLKKVHKSITTLQGEDIVFLATDINLPGAVDWVMMQSCFGYNFMLVLEKQEKFDHGQQVFYAVVQLIGAKKEADNFMYRLELSTHRRRLCWEATPRSIHEGVAHAIQLSDCLAFDTPTAQLFAENGNLGINVTISMV